MPEIIRIMTAESTITNSAAAPHADDAHQPTDQTTPRPDTVRDTIESIVVAFIMAFVFRAFIVEAFVIPTGSMATSLYGQHGQHRCSMCQYPFAYGIREAVPGTGQNSTLAKTYSVQCPNCTWDGDGNRDLNRPDNPVVANSGDRILVLKWPYDISGSWLGPQRWDVVVFKDPQDGETNFIKRLIGLPGEVLELINGDVYTAPVESVPADVLQALRQPPPRNSDQRRLSSEQAEALAGVLQIRRKTPIAQRSLWMLHYDHDYTPKTRRSRSRREFNPPRWKGVGATDQQAWNASTPVIRFNPPDDQTYRLQLKGDPIQDDYGYNSVDFSQKTNRVRWFVGDVRLKFVLSPRAEDGEVILQLTKGPDRFRARIQTDGNIRLERADNHGIWIKLKDVRMGPLRAGEARAIEFENLDYRVALRVDGKEVAWTELEDYKPDILRLLQRPNDQGRSTTAAIEILGQGAPFELRHVQVHRDVFYRSDFKLSRRADGSGPSFHNFPGWGTATNPILLRSSPPDFFCCGDNSPQSKDSRLWVDVCPMLMDHQSPNNYQYGTVPGDQMIGRAFFVYWPSGLRFSKETPAVIPNVGRMRIIR